MEVKRSSFDKRGNPSETDHLKDKPFNRKIIWHRVAVLIIAQTAAFYGLYLCLMSGKWATIAFGK